MLQGSVIPCKLSITSAEFGGRHHLAYGVTEILQTKGNF